MTMFETLGGLFGTKANEVWKDKLEKRGAHLTTLLIIILCGWLGYTGMLTDGFLIVVMTGVVIYEFVKRMDQGLPLMQVAALLAVLQWLVGPWLTYHVDFFYSTYIMRVPSDVYFSFAFPGTAAFVVGLLAVGVSARQRGLMLNLDRSHFMQLGIILAGLGFAGGLGAKLLSGGGLAFVFYLLSQLRYVGALYFIFSRHPLRWICAGLSIFPLLTGSAATGMFHDLMLWMGIIVCYWYALRRRKLWITICFLFFGLAGAFTIQGIKRSYRDKVWNDEKGSLTEEVRNFWARPQAMVSEETLANGIIRLNQGWIVAAIMQNVPSQEPYAMGDTLGDALEAALIPRLISEDKTMAGGRVSFRRFTGLPISDTTSMGLSLLGESYANVGAVAGILVMLLSGGVMSLAYGFCLVWSTKHPTFYFWIPVIFCQTIKAETDLVTVLNHVTKGSIVAFGLYWLICIKLFPEIRARGAAGRRFTNSRVSLLSKRRLANKLRVEEAARLDL